MLRFENNIRLTPKERETFAALAVDSSVPPKTVEENNQRMDFAAAVWGEDDTPEGRLMAAVAIGAKI